MSLYPSTADEKFEKKMFRLQIVTAISTSILIFMDLYTSAIILAIYQVILYLICIRKDLTNIQMEIQDLNFYMRTSRRKEHPDYNKNIP